MAVDVRRVIQAAVEAALEEPAPRKRRLTGGKALLLGAGLMTAGRLAVGSRGREALGSLRQRVGELADFDGDADDVPDEEDLEELDDDQEAELDDDPEALDDQEELDDDQEPAPEPEAPRRSTRGR
jgi:hypothetical protein